MTTYTKPPISDELEPSLKSVCAEWKWWLSGAILSFICASILMSGFPEGLLPNLKYPFGYSDDRLFSLFSIQNCKEGWIFNNLRVGYPWGSLFWDYPGSDAGSLFILKLLALLFGESFRALNLYFLGGFFVVFVCSYFILRLFKLRIAFAISASALFTFAPFHFMRLGHLFYTWYFMIPIMLHIGFQLFKGCQISRRQFLIWGVFVFISSLFGVYYTLFSCILIAFSGLAGAIRNRKTKIFLWSISLVLVMSCGVVCNVAPSYFMKYKTGPNPEIAVRSPVESEIYAFKPVQLVLPRQGHRITKLANFRSQYDQSFPLNNENSISSLGIIGSCGLLSVFIVLLLRFCKRECNPQIEYFCIITLLFITWGMIGGFGTLFALLFSPMIRGWNRISIFIAFSTLLSLFLILQEGLSKNCSPQKRTLYVYCSAIALLVIGLYDQTVPANRGYNHYVKSQFDMDRTFISQIEQTLPKKSAIYQLPYIPFPEWPPLHRLDNYGLCTGFIHSKTLRWSANGMKGRSGDLFYRALSKESVQTQLNIIRKLGFAGIYVDKRGFTDNGAGLIQELTKQLGEAPMLSREDGEIVFFRIKDPEPVNFTGMTPEAIMQKIGYYADQHGVRYPATISEGIDFRKHGLPSFLRKIEGLSGEEPWGRWSDANTSATIKFNFTEPLPNIFTLSLLANAFGPNQGQESTIRIGKHSYKLQIYSGQEAQLKVNLQGEISDTIEIIPYNPTSPLELGQSNDSRKLGIGFIKMQIKKISLKERNPL